MRKTKLVTIEAENRDQGKQFLVTEMAASQAEKWAARAFLALAKSGIEIPDESASMGMAGMLVVGLKALGGISWELAEPLLDEMFECLTVPTKFQPRKLTESDIEEVTTRLMLRKEILELHLGFSLAAAPSISAEATVQDQPTVSAPITKMFPGASR